MTTDSILTKRRARHVGEIGLFPDNPMAEDDLALAKDGEEVVCRWYSVRNIEGLKYLWALVHKVAQNTDRYLDKDEAMEDLKIRAAFTKVIFNNKQGELEVRPKSLTKVTNEELRALTERIVQIVCNQIIPGMAPGDLRREVEKMVGNKGESK